MDQQRLGFKGADTYARPRLGQSPIRHDLAFQVNADTWRRKIRKSKKSMKRPRPRIHSDHVQARTPIEEDNNEQKTHNLETAIPHGLSMGDGDGT